MSPITCPWPRVFRRLEPLVAETRAPSSRMWLRRWPLPHAAVLRHPRMVSLNQRLAMKSHLPKGGGTTLKTRLLNKYDNIKVYQGYHFILGKSWKCECAYENGRFFIAKFFSPRRATQSSIFIHTNCHLILLTPKQYSMKWMIAICMLVVSIIIHYNGHYDYDIDDYYSFFLAQTDPSGFAQRVWHHRGHLPGDRDLVVSGVPFHPGLMSDLIKKNLSTSHL